MPAVQRKHPGKSRAPLVKLIGQKWRELKASDKPRSLSKLTKYHTAFGKDMAAYQQELDLYKETWGVNSKGKRMKKAR